MIQSCVIMLVWLGHLDGVQIQLHIAWGFGPSFPTLILWFDALARREMVRAWHASLSVPVRPL